MPVLAFAQFVPVNTGPNFNYIGNGVGNLFGIVSTYLVPILMLAAFAYFVWGVIGYIRAVDEKTKKERRHTMISGVIALAVIVSVWGLVALLQSIFGVGGISNQVQPCPPGYIQRNSRCYPG